MESKSNVWRAIVKRMKNFDIVEQELKPENNEICDDKRQAKDQKNVYF